MNILIEHADISFKDSPFTEANAKMREEKFNKVLEDQITKSQTDFENLDKEDKLLYQELFEAKVDLTNHTLDWQKQHIKTLGFPPLTAPSKVRAAWREALEKIPAADREKLLHDIKTISVNMRHRFKVSDKEMSSSNFSYSDYIDKMAMVTGDLSINGLVGNYSFLSSFLTEFKSKLDK